MLILRVTDTYTLILAIWLLIAYTHYYSESYSTPLCLFRLGQETFTALVHYD